jgi:hypothetical protein
MLLGNPDSIDRMLRIKNKLTIPMPKTFARGGNVLNNAFKLGGYIKHINKHKFPKIK